MKTHTREALRTLPAVDELLARCEALLSAPSSAQEPPRWALVSACRHAIDERRRLILAGESDDGELRAEAVLTAAAKLALPPLRPVINASGVVIHTNLGRAPLASAAIERVCAMAGGYSTLEYDLAAGARGSRHVHVAQVLRELTGAEDAVVVNNNAGAVMLGLAALAAGREAIVSRGELVEIGGSFRIPDVMELSGAKLVEVGTTNRTHPADYRRAIGEQTGLLFKAHRSNFAVVGFTKEVEPEELTAIGHEAGVPSMFDLGSGTLIDLTRLGLRGGDETPVAEAVAAGFDLVTFSGDKLLGGPQAGMLVGRRDAIEACRRHPLMRALRPDKLCLAALDATLALYREGRAEAEVPVVRMLAATPESLEPLATRLRDALLAALGQPWQATLREVSARAGGGSYPNVELRSLAVALTHPEHKATELEAGLRAAEPPVIARIEDGLLLFDVRCLHPESGCDALLASAVPALRSTAAESPDA
jgi:L-seryl-tRNA(Ser) seleniumtransferase